MVIHQISNSLSNYNYNAFIYTNTNWDEHFHGNYELVYVFDGKTKITINGTQDTLLQGEIILIPPYTVHSLEIDNAKTWVGVFSEDHIVSYSKKYKYIRSSKFTLSNEVEQILKSQLFFEGTPDRFMLISCLYMVCNECIKNATSHKSEQNYEFISGVVNYIHNNIENNISLIDVATSMNYEQHYFSCLFHQYFSMNFKNFVNFFRFEKACTLLAQEKYTITYVAESCGFGSIRNFNRVFKKLGGCTPKEYKKGLT